jgi:hypothetical protein
MSDSIKKYWELVEDGVINPDEKTTQWHLKSRKVVSEGHKRQAYNILVEYPEEAILEAARILKDGK